MYYRLQAYLAATARKRPSSPWLCPRRGNSPLEVRTEKFDERESRQSNLSLGRQGREEKNRLEARTTPELESTIPPCRPAAPD